MTPKIGHDISKAYDRLERRERRERMFATICGCLGLLAAYFFVNALFDWVG